jgi:hypothetical protein
VSRVAGSHLAAVGSATVGGQQPHRALALSPCKLFGKQVTEREEVIEDQLRRKDVDVQKLGRTTRT